MATGLSYAQSQNLSLSFNQLKVTDGLSEGTNVWTYRDTFGFTWISSQEGLNRFDGSTVKVYKADPSDSTSLNDNIITSGFFEDDEHNLWFTSYNAIHKYVRKKDHFEIYKLKDREGRTITEDYIGFYLFDGKFWVKTGVKESGIFHQFDIHSRQDSIVGSLRGYRQSVLENKMGQPLAVISSFLIGDDGIRITPLSNEVIFYRQSFFNGEGYPSTLVTKTDVVSPSEIWLSTSLGLIFLDPVTGEYEIFQNSDQGALGKVNSTSHYNSYLFIGTAKNGLFLMDRKTREIINHFLPSNNLDYHLRKKEISMTNVDNKGCLWISYYENLKPFGLDYAVVYKNRFPRFDPDIGGNRYTTSMLQTKDGIYVNDGEYIGLINGLNKVVQKWSLGDPVNNIFQDANGEVWAVSKKDGQVNTTLYKLRKGASLKKVLESNLDIQDALKLQDGTIIFSTYGQGVYRLIQKDDIYYLEKDDHYSRLSDALVFEMFQDHKGNIYFAVNYDRLVIYRQKERSVDFIKEVGNLGNCKDFYDYVEDASVWIASANGIVRMDLTNMEHAFLGEDKGIPVRKYYSITRDLDGDFWFKTERGLIKYETETTNAISYSVVDGVRPIIVGNSHPAVLTSEGFIWMAGQDGMNIFHPDSIEPLASPPSPQIVQISINEAPYKSDVSHSMVDSLNLGFSDNTVAFDFVPCHYSDPNSIRYQYRLIGYNDSWVESKGSGFARYFSLPPGDYTFEARTGNSENNWSTKPASIAITIHPPWWATTWAYIFYGLTLITTVFFIIRTEKRKQRLKLLQERRKVAQEKKINEELRKVDRLKDQFLANTSHELRTPLNGIIGLAESLVDGATGRLPEKTVKNLQMIASSGKRLSNLVNDILDFSRLRSDDLSLDKRPVDLFAAVDVVTTLLQPLRKDTSIEMKNEVDRELPLLYADENRLQQILYNILGNAIKFTHEGHIRVFAEQNGDFIEVSVEDTGIGIPEADFDRVFRSFEQVDGSTERRYEGTGLGLSVTRKLVELHGGKIRLKSKVGVGSTFTFSLPVSDADRSTVEPAMTPDHISEVGPALETIPDSTQTDIILPKDAHRILIVDDEPVNRTVLENHLLTAGYASVQAKDGKTALQMLAEEKFDMVLLDIMMPGMSGYEVCREIRKHKPAIQLPVIMLTAKNRVNDLVEGFLVGANDYIAKPFSKDELLARIHTHLNLMSIYSASGRFVPYEFLNAIGHDEITQVKRGDHTEAEVTVLFADIREFTRLSESMTPTENFQFVNTFVGRMGPVIQKNKGFVNQYLGDGIMAIFPHRSQDAIDAAWQMLKELEVFNALLVSQGKEAIRIGIGLHTGPLIMGIIGDENRTDPATIADAVNTSSRLEGLTKYYKAPIIVSEVSLEQYKGHDASQFRFLGKVKLKGKKQVIGIYECITGDSEEVKVYKIKTAPIYSRAIEAYQKGDLESALEHFKEILKEGVQDAVVERFIDRIQTLLEGDLPPDWQAIEVMTRK
jgi:signal transduction histidine kinase/DNA-binding response OmpR family regulator/ligand-binding sensor domain-containing protein